MRYRCPGYSRRRYRFRPPGSVRRRDGRGTPPQRRDQPLNHAFAPRFGNTCATLQAGCCRHPAHDPRITGQGLGHSPIAAPPPQCDLGADSPLTMAGVSRVGSASPRRTLTGWLSRRVKRRRQCSGRCWRRGLSRLWAQAGARARPPPQRPEVAPAVRRRWRQRLASPAPLAASESFQLLADYGIPVAPTLPAAALPDAITAAERIG